MKKHLSLLIVCLCFGFPAANAIAEAARTEAKSSLDSQECPAVLQHDMQRLRSAKIQNLCDYRGQVILVVNTASRCGFTPQFKGLEALYQRYKDKGFTVLGFPSNDFNQELSDNKEIASFCEINYGVSFPMFERSSVKGANANNFYKGLIRATDQEPAWNFNKYLIDRSGKVVSHFGSSVKPQSNALLGKIDALL